MSWPRRIRIEAVFAEPLSVPLHEPFVVATGRVDVTPSVLVTALVRDEAGGQLAQGLGEAATFQPITREGPKDVLFSVLEAAGRLRGRTSEIDPELQAIVTLTREVLPSMPVARAGLQTALVDALAQLAGIPVRELLGGARGRELRHVTSDMTIPIAAPAHMAQLAIGWRTKGFRCFKVKVGRDLDQALQALEAIHHAVPDATYRLDANAVLSAAEAIALANECAGLGLTVECFEQPCGRLALEAMAEVAQALEIPVVADESVSTLEDLERVAQARAADAVNLKLVKSGGPVEAFAIGRRAQALGLGLMTGAMVESRLGISAAAHVTAALGGVQFPDLDTAWLLASDPFEGGYVADGADYTLLDGPGLGVRRR